MLMKKPFNAEQRRRIVSSYAKLNSEYFMAGFEHADNPNLTLEIADRLAKVRTEYLHGLPDVPIARCPFCEQVNTHSFDPFGIDGPWWWRMDTVRPTSEPGLCPHFLSMGGAMRLKEPLEDSRAMAMVGPGKPYVVPPVLKHPDIQAVINALPVGHHVAFPVVYFATNPPVDVRLMKIWPTSYHPPGFGRVSAEYNDVTPDYFEDEFDYELGPWIDSGKLLWTAPRDSTFALMRTTADCPYINIQGTPNSQYVKNGKLIKG